jgi:hypothetical protein
VVRGRLIGLHLLRPIIERSERGRKKTVRKKRVKEEYRRRKKGINITSGEEEGTA